MLKPVWTRVGAFASTSLCEARIELHWAAQILSAAADAQREHAADDSHTNLHWDETIEGLVSLPLPNPTGTSALALSFSDFALLQLIGKKEVARFELVGRTLGQALEWTAAQLDVGGKFKTRDYDMPKHDGTFATPTDAVRELGRYYASATAVLSALAARDRRATPIAVWPHHFDLGGILFLEEGNPEKAAQIGFGLSPGDGTIEEPYFYVTPYPIADGVELPAIEGGGWHTEGFTAAVLRASDLSDLDADKQHAHAETYLRSAVSVSERLIGHGR